MTDLAALAQQAVQHLGPLLPHAAGHAATQFADGFFKQPGAKLFDWLAKKFKGTPSEAALEQAIADPGNEFALSALQTQIAYRASKDPEFLRELTSLLKDLAQTSVTASQTVNNTGDNNNIVFPVGTNIHVRIG